MQARPGLILGAMSMLAAVVVACGGGAEEPTSTPTVQVTETPQASSAPAAPTSSIGRPSNTLQEALGQARRIFTASPPFLVHEIESVVYVETTAGEARDLFDPNRFIGGGRWIADAPDDAPGWVVVAYGRFQSRPMPGSTTPVPPHSMVWVAVPIGEGVPFHGTDLRNRQYDLSRLGQVVAVPVPLAPFPTPVQLDSP